MLHTLEQPASRETGTVAQAVKGSFPFLESIVRKSSKMCTERGWQDGSVGKGTFHQA